MFFLVVLSSPGRRKSRLYSRSSEEAELQATTLLTTEVTWLCWLLEKFGDPVTIPTTILYDSTCATNITRDLVKHELTKYIRVDASFVHASVYDQVVALHYVLYMLYCGLWPHGNTICYSPNSSKPTESNRDGRNHKSQAVFSASRGSDRGDKGGGIKSRRQEGSDQGRQPLVAAATIDSWAARWSIKSSSVPCLPVVTCGMGLLWAVGWLVTRRLIVDQMSRGLSMRWC
jgi:hypothetical protein